MYVYAMFSFSLLKFFIYLFTHERYRDISSPWETWRGTQFQDPEIMTWGKGRCSTLSHPGAPIPCFLYLFILQWIFGLFSISWLMWITMQWTWECWHLFEILVSVLLDIHPELGSLDHTVVVFLIFFVFLIFEEPPYYFP